MEMIKILRKSYAYFIGLKIEAALYRIKNWSYICKVIYKEKKL